MNPKLLLCLALLWLTVVFAAYGKSTVFSVTPKNPDGGGQLVFVVTNTAVSNGLSFHVIAPNTGLPPEHMLIDPTTGLPLKRGSQP